MHRWRRVLVAFLLFALTASTACAKKIVIGNDLDSVVDNEEDESWKEWGKAVPHVDPPSDEELDTPDANEIAKVLQGGPPIGFIKLRYNPERTMDDNFRTAARWSELMRSGGLKIKFYPIDLNTLHLSISDRAEMIAMKNVILEDPEAYEINIGGHRYRRPGDPPLDQVAGEKEWIEQQMRLQAKQPPPERRIPEDYLEKKKKKKKKKSKRTEAGESDHEEL